MNLSLRARHQGPEGRMIYTGIRFACFIAALLSLGPAHAADAVERPYNPPVGSKWIIESETRSADTRPDGPRSSVTKIRAELTIDARTPDGFRVSYVNRGASIEGNDPTAPMLRSAMKALENVPIHATTDLAGKPVRVDNLDEAKAALRNMVDSLTAPFQDKPQVVAVLKQMVNGLIEVDADQAAGAYVEEMPTLAKAQNTGMKPGEVRRSSRVADNPLGGAGTLKSSEAFELTEADGATGKRVYVSTTSYDMASMKDFMQSVSKKLMAAAGSSVKPEQIDSLVKSMVLTLDERAVFEVEDGMTRKITGKSLTTVRAMGHNLQKTEDKTLTITRAP
jgi:hypothetical protein